MDEKGEGKPKERTPLQRTTGQGKEGTMVEGKKKVEIKYPMPTPCTLAFMEEEFGSLASFDKGAKRHPYRMTLMLVFFLEMQKDGKEDEVAMMTARERRGAASRLLKEKKIDLEVEYPIRAKLAMEVFTRVRGVSKMK